MSRHIALSLTVSLLIGSATYGQPPGKPADSPNLGKTIGDFTLRDIAGKPVSLAQFKDRKAIAVVFLGTQCPINNQYMPRLAELHREFAAQEVQFVAINANRQDSLAVVIDHAKKNAIPFPVLRDVGNVVADRFGAERNPEAFVLDDKRVIRYQGRIDDQFGFDYQRKAPTRRDLAEALTEVLAGKQVTRPTTTVAGCIIGRVRKTAPNGNVDFARHIAPILQHHCQACHRPGQIGPMPLQKYDDVVSWSGMIKEVVSEGRMPPWYADPKHGKFKNDRSMPKDQRDRLLAWIDSGMPRGNDKDLPPPVHYPEGWAIGKPDQVISIKEFHVPAETPKGGIRYKYVRVDLNLTEDKWIERAEAKAGAPEVVHHILAFIVPPKQTFIPGNPRTPVLCGMAPGESPMILPDGMAKLIPKGAHLMIQMHYTPNGKAQIDRSSIAMTFARKPPQKMVIARPVYQQWFRIPPGAENHEVQAYYTFPKDGYVIGMMPHMHLRGKDFLVQKVSPDKQVETLLSVPRFNFNWQAMYRPLEPIPMPKGTRMVCTAHFDNSAKNLSNPDPTVNVYWGDQTWQEMMIGWMDFAFDMPQEPAKKNN